jgi:hypothetical protein
MMNSNMLNAERERVAERCTWNINGLPVFRLMRLNASFGMKFLMIL